MKADGAPPLNGLKVVELARILAGPWAGQVLADLGAEVIKIESPAGDDTRRWGPPFVNNADGTRDAAYFHSANRGKRSVVADFTTAEGQRLVRELVADADVLIENFKVGGLAKYGLDYESLSALNPRLVYCSITGFGQDGPYAHRAGYDFIVQGMSGIMDLTGGTGRRAAENRRRLCRHHDWPLCRDRHSGRAVRAGAYGSGRPYRHGVVRCHDGRTG